MDAKHAPERTQEEWQAQADAEREGIERAWHWMEDQQAYDEDRYGELYREWQEASGDYETPFVVWLDEYMPWDHD